MFLFFPLSLSLCPEIVHNLYSLFQFFLAIISFAWTGVSETDLRDVRGAGHQESAVSTGRCSRRLHCQRPRAGPEILKDSWKFLVWRALQKSPTFRFLFDIFLHQACFQNWRLCYLIIFHFPKKCMLFFWFSQLRQLFVFWLFTPCFFPSLSPILDGLLGTPQVFRSKLHSFLMILGFRDGWWM